MLNDTEVTDSPSMEMSSSLFSSELTTEVLSVPAPKSFSDEAYRTTTLYLYCFIGIVSAFGLISNLANLVVFAKQGVQESTTFSFLSLAVTDLGICIATFSAFVCYFIDKYNPYHVVDVNAMRRVCIYVRIAFSEMSMFTTVFLSVERCLCVVMPLTFKKIITRNRTILILCLLYIEVAVWYGLFFANMPMGWYFDGRKNMTRFKFTFSDDYSTVQNIHTYTNGFFLPIVLVGLVTISTVFMIFGLWRASRFRTKSSSANNAESGKNKVSSISAKEARLVKIVIYLLVIFIATYIFVFAIDIIDKTKMEIEFNVFMTLWTVAHLVAVINASANAIVYFNMSTKYHEIFTSVFCACFADEKKAANTEKYTASTAASS